MEEKKTLPLPLLLQLLLLGLEHRPQLVVLDHVYRGDLLPLPGVRHHPGELTLCKPELHRQEALVQLPLRLHAGDPDPEVDDLSLQQHPGGGETKFFQGAIVLLLLLKDLVGVEGLGEDNLLALLLHMVDLDKEPNSREGLVHTKCSSNQVAS